MQHNPGFLKLVDHAKSRVKQIDIEEYKKMQAGGDQQYRYMRQPQACHA